MQFVFEHRVVSFKQLAKRFFYGAKVPTVLVRLDKLRSMGLLSKTCVLWKEKRCAVFEITNNGINLIADLYKYKITAPNFKSDSVYHDLALVIVRERLEKTKMVVEYLSESALQSCAYFKESETFSAFVCTNSDAALVIDTPLANVQVALEYEISDKSESRYIKKLTDYYYALSVSAVFYICGNVRIEKIIRKVDAEIGQKFEAKVFTCLEETIHSGVEALPFRNRNNAIFSLI